MKNIFIQKTIPLIIFSSCGIAQKIPGDIKISGPELAMSADAEAEKISSKIREGNFEGVRLQKFSTDQVVDTVVFNISTGGLSLNDSNSSMKVEMEERAPVGGTVAAKKYLKLTGNLVINAAADNRAYDVGCLHVELKDNVYFREKTWLRLASTPVKGQNFSDIIVPLSVNASQWRPVPILNDSLTLMQFSENTVKKFDSELCFRLDFSNVPADQYKGEVVVQYLKPGITENPPSCQCPDPTKVSGCLPTSSGATLPSSGDDPGVTTQDFSCGTKPMVLAAGQSTEIEWVSANFFQTPIAVSLSGEGSGTQTDLGQLSVISPWKYKYTAPPVVAQNMKILATANVINAEFMPAICQINLVGSSDLGVKDDGEVRGLPGNVYRISDSTTKLPDLSALTPVTQVVASNLDVANRHFSKGFPGVPDLFEWFAIKFSGTLIVPTTGNYEIQLTSDDGAILYLDNNKVIDNDGVHSVSSKTAKISLTKGNHVIRIDYFEGPRYYIALQLFWRNLDKKESLTVIPPSAFDRPLQ